MANQTLTWKLKLAKGEIDFGRFTPFAGNVYPVRLEGGEAGAAYDVYVMSPDGLACLARTVLTASGHRVSFNSEWLRDSFERLPHEIRAFHAYAKDGAGGVVAEGELQLQWQPLWEDPETGEVYAMRGPKGEQGERGPRGERGPAGAASVIGYLHDPDTGTWHAAGCTTNVFGEKVLTVADQASTSPDQGNLWCTADGASAARTLADRLGDALSVKDFGAKGDGETDDTGAVNAALAHGGRVRMPAGDYLVTGTLKVKSDTVLEGDGAGATRILFRSSDAKARAVMNLHAYRRLATAGDRAMFSDWGDDAVYDERIVIRDLTVDMAWHRRFDLATTPASIGGPSAIELGGVRHAVVSGVAVVDAGKNCFNTKAFYTENNVTGFDDYGDIPGRSSDICFVGCTATGFWEDDAFTTHMTDDCVVRDCLAELTPYLAPGETEPSLWHRCNVGQCAVEFDCGSRRCVADGIVSRGVARCVSVVSHKGELPCEDVVGMNSNAHAAYYPFMAWKEAEPAGSLFPQMRNVNVAFTNCVSDGLGRFADNDRAALSSKPVPLYALNLNGLTVMSCRFAGAAVDATTDYLALLNRVSAASLQDIRFAMERSATDKCAIYLNNSCVSQIGNVTLEHSVATPGALPVVDVWNSCTIGRIDGIDVTDTNERIYLVRCNDGVALNGDMCVYGVSNAWRIKQFRNGAEYWIESSSETDGPSGVRVAQLVLVPDSGTVFPVDNKVQQLGTDGKRFATVWTEKGSVEARLAALETEMAKFRSGFVNGRS